MDTDTGRVIVLHVRNGREFYETATGGLFDKPTGDRLLEKGLATFSTDGKLCLLPSIPERCTVAKLDQAVIDEREACAKIAENYRLEPGTMIFCDRNGSMVAPVAEAIAGSIRNRPNVTAL
jgi:hypothetical protein